MPHLGLHGSRFTGGVQDEGPFLARPVPEHDPSAHPRFHYRGQRQCVGWSAACPLCQALRAHVNAVTRTEAAWLPSELTT